MEENTGFTRQNSYTLTLLTLSFIIGEISHFLIGVLSMEIARDLHFGDKSCALNPNTLDLYKHNTSNTYCDQFTSDGENAQRNCEAHLGNFEFCVKIWAYFLSQSPNDTLLDFTQLCLDCRAKSNT